MQRFGTGYTGFFNKKYKRNGSLFQGKFKASKIRSESHLNYVSAYINLNNKVHKIGDNKLVRNSWKEYIEGSLNSISSPGNVLENFKDRNEYKKYALRQLESILDERYFDEDKKDLLE